MQAIGVLISNPVNFLKFVIMLYKIPYTRSCFVIHVGYPNQGQGGKCPPYGFQKGSEYIHDRRAARTKNSIYTTVEDGAINQ